MAVSITPPDANRTILEDDGTMEQSFRSWTYNVTRLALIIGTGSPEGVVPAIQGAEYMNSAGTTGSLKYTKRNSEVGGDPTQGWVVSG